MLEPNGEPSKLYRREERVQNRFSSPYRHGSMSHRSVVIELDPGSESVAQDPLTIQFRRLVK